MESPGLFGPEDAGGGGEAAESIEKAAANDNVEKSGGADSETETNENLFGEEDEAMSEGEEKVAQQEEAEEGLQKEEEDGDEEEPSANVDKSMLRQESQESGAVKNESQEQSELKELTVPQSHEIVIPNYARWFDLRKIHSIERQSLPEFFTNRIASKTPQVYVRYRNFMVNSYRLNPNEYFSVTAARRNVCGDAAAIFRVHKFLMKWGLINYQVDAKLLPKNVEPPFTGEFSTRHDAPRGLFPFESYKPSVQLPDMAKLKKMMDTNDENSALHKYLETRKRKMSNQIDSEAPEDKVKDEEKTEIEEDQASSTNPVKKAKILENVDDQWSREELQKLLKGLQEHGSDWYKVAKSIDTKTPEQCILKFLQLPIEDRFLHSPGKDSGPLKYAPHLPFSKSDNPVMSTVAFLVGLVDPRVVRQMTGRAITAMEDIDKEENKDSDELKEASEIALSSLGARSHVFATNEERQINAIASELVEVQLAKAELKLKFLTKIERALELERKSLQRQQEDTLIQRLALSKHSHLVYQKLQESLEIIDDKDKLASHLAEIKQLLDCPPKLSIGAAFGLSQDGSTSPSSTQRLNAKSEDEVKPVSIEAPQFYRYWSA
ncbi:hypothetical protein HG536_0A02000 [Torulaspora globosa]|uniref:SWIRM domain-containing protein n=1 Tax=Torulaspora globosa TaxID=48254 RepID=A0A7G3ZA47_9SACH|nr:uncharacterized protein HG536_0A02000 [Torulaspora globosa]QLL30383.1 hypothetical protein HG536_0A02000 [Torulaspora globosa]